MENEFNSLAPRVVRVSTIKDRLLARLREPAWQIMSANAADFSQAGKIQTLTASSRRIRAVRQRRASTTDLRELP